MRQLVIAIRGLNKDIRVAEHINVEWLLQANEHDVFSWLQTTFRQKESYVFHDEIFVIVISYEELSPTKINDLTQLKNKTLF